jgi:ketol-acid reductoisomerase
LVEAGISPEVAYLECVGELKLIADLIDARGIAGMREAISNTAELGAVLGGPAVIGPEIRDRMLKVLQSVQSGEFARRLHEEAETGYPKLEAARQAARSDQVERVYQDLRKVSDD